MIEEKYILIILNCKKYREKAIQQKETWLKYISMPYFHVLGDPELTSEFMFNNDEHILYVKCDDDYNSLPKKMIRAYKAILKTYHFSYIFKTDDDQYLEPAGFLDNMKRILEEKKPKIHYAGRINNVTIPHISQYYRIHPELPKDLKINATKYCSGRFYVLSFDAVLDLSNKQQLIDEEYFEDYAIGYYLSDKLKLNMLDIKVDKYFKDF